VSRAIWAGAVLLAALLFLPGCSFFARQPPLPRRAAIEPAGNEQKFFSLVQDADILYFPSESAAFRSRSEAAWKLLEALRRGSGSFAIGWDWARMEGDRRDYLDEAGRSGAEILVLNEIRERAENESGASADEFIADKIAGYFRDHRNDKMLVFLRRQHLGIDHGVPFLVAQHTKARQLILNPQRSDSGRRLLARR
jgi:hypothetical protein